MNTCHGFRARHTSRSNSSGVSDSCSPSRLTVCPATSTSGFSLAAFLATRESDDDDAPPAGRIHFLSVIGLTITPLFLAIVLMSSAGAIIANGCTQS